MGTTTERVAMEASKTPSTRVVKKAEQGSVSKAYVKGFVNGFVEYYGDKYKDVKCGLDVYKKTNEILDEGSDMIAHATDDAPFVLRGAKNIIKQHVPKITSAIEGTINDESVAKKYLLSGLIGFGKDKNMAWQKMYDRAKDKAKSLDNATTPKAISFTALTGGAAIKEAVIIGKNISIIDGIAPQIGYYVKVDIIERLNRAVSK